MRGLVHVYTGEGKGKTTAALGQALRAYGSGLRVLVMQFLKSAPTGELEAAAQLGERFRIVRPEQSVRGFVWNMTKPQRETYRSEMCRGLECARQLAQECDVLVLDEAFGCVTNRFFSAEELLEFVRQKPEALELVLTGRDAPPEIVAAADYVSEIHCVKHPMECGIAARKGIEF